MTYNTPSVKRNILVICAVAALLDIHGISRAATEYVGDGAPGGAAEEQRWLINRARYNPEYEADRVGLTNSTPGGHPDYDVCEDSQDDQDFGTTTNDWAPWLVSRPPLASCSNLIVTTQNHCEDIAAVGFPDGFQHNSPTNTHYTNNTPFYERFLLEGYDYSWVGENLVYNGRGNTGGYPSYGLLPSDANDALFVDLNVESRGHRKSILFPEFREIGISTVQSREYKDPYYFTYDCYAQDFGSRSGLHFFTGSIFYDANSNGVYDSGEGRSGIEIRLFDATNEVPWFDVSESNGNFAVPITNIEDNTEVEVSLVNRSGTDAPVTVPLGYNSLGNIHLTNNEWYALGTFIQPVGITNVGFRNLSQRVENSSMAVGMAQNQVNLGFDSMIGARYVAEYATDLTATNWIVFSNFTATSESQAVIDTNAVEPHKFYRIRLLKD